MSNIARKKPSVKFLWSHQGVIHRLLVRYANKILGLVPFNIKYAIGVSIKKNQIPYSLVEGKTVIQVGAPFDTLTAGRSRGMYFSKLVGKNGRVLIVEPLRESVEAFREKVEILKLPNIVVHESGAWSEASESFINVDLRHPATNYTESTVDYSEERESQFNRISISLNTLDNIARINGIGKVDLISITTNWAEEEILQGSSGLLTSGVEYIALAYGKNGEIYENTMEKYGYKLISHDDRGVTYRRIGDASVE